MAHLYTRDGKMWQPGHSMWPTKGNGEPYIRISKQLMSRMKRDGTWPELYKSVTEYLRILSGHHLINWALGLGVDAAIDTIGKLKADDHVAPGMLREICYDAALELRNSPSNIGTNVHDALAKSLQDAGYTDDNIVHSTAILKLHEWLKSKSLWQYVEDKNFRSENGFTFCDWCWNLGREIRYGGTRDLVIGDCLIDFKTTKEKRPPYVSECAQLAAYNRECNKKYVCNLYFSSVTGEIIGEKLWSEDELHEGWNLFQTCVSIDYSIEKLQDEMNGGLSD